MGSLASLSLNNVYVSSGRRVHLKSLRKAFQAEEDDLQKHATMHVEGILENGK